ncbi:Protein indeterminate-domain 12 [Forsythia ovata]|uniref:Protein indeterminate-domain 12 n=1 Tax=Forsythia ovata TaxID=205694 RepID=A0ABD1X477_9LAMI
MFPGVMSNSTNSQSEEASVSSGSRVHDFGSLNSVILQTQTDPQKIKKKRSLPGNPDPDAEVIALSPKTLLATNRFVCEICNKGFQRDQNLQLHRRGHNLPWKLKQRNSQDNRKRAYVCPEPTCVHNHPSRALGDLTGIKKHYCRKHGEKKWKCEKCSKIYAVQSDWRAHSKTCGTREYRCDCGTLFSRKDSFITHRAFCDALAEESTRISANSILTAAAEVAPPPTNPNGQHYHLRQQSPPPPPLYHFSSQQLHLQNPPFHTPLNPWNPPQNPKPSQNQLHIKPETTHIPMISSPFYQEFHKNLMASPFRNVQVSAQSEASTTASVAPLSATALLQKAATVGAHSIGHVNSTMTQLDMGTIGHVTTTRAEPPEYLAFVAGNLSTWQKCDGLTRDFLGLTGDQCGGGGGANGNGNGTDLLSFTGGVEFSTYDHDQSLLKHQAFEFAEPYN